MLKYFYLLMILAVVLSFYVWQQTQPVRLGYKVETLSTERQKWEHENKMWQLKINNLLSMERLDQVAKQNNLAAPDQKRIIYLKNDDK